MRQTVAAIFSAAMMADIDEALMLISLAQRLHVALRERCSVVR